MISSAELFFYMFFMPSTVDYKDSKLITHDYYWLFSMYGYPLWPSTTADIGM